MGAINIFVIQLSRPLAADKLENYIKTKSFYMNLDVKLHHHSPQREHSTTTNAYFKLYSNVLDLHFYTLGVLTIKVVAF